MVASNAPLDRRFDDMDLGGMASAYGSYVSLSADAAASLGSMEGVFEAAAARRPWPALVPGYFTAALVAAIAYSIPKTALATATSLDRISPTMWAILLGLTVRTLLPLTTNISAGCKDVVRRVIPIAIVCIGAGLNFTVIASVGLQTLAITLVRPSR